MQACNRCLDCNDVLCETCVAKHQGHPAFQDHCVVTLSNLSPIGSSTSIPNGSPTHNEPQCDIHGEVLRYAAAQFIFLIEIPIKNVCFSVLDTYANNAIKLFVRNVLFGIIRTITA